MRAKASLQPIALALEDHRVRLPEEPVDGSVGKRTFREDFAPFFDRTIGCQREPRAVLAPIDESKDLCVAVLRKGGNIAPESLTVFRPEKLE
jgi:hypothetical protein